MGIDLRYHIASLMAVFLAFGLGILVGTLLVPNAALPERVNVVVTRLEKDFAKIRDESKSVRRQIDFHSRVENEMVPLAADKKLEGKLIAFIETTDASVQSVQSDILQVLQQSGAKIHSVTVIKRYFGMEDEAVKKEILTHLGIKETDEKKASKNIAARVAQEISSGKPFAALPLLNYLESLDAVSVEGGFSAVPSAVVILGGRNRYAAFPDAMDLPLVRAFKTAKIRVVGTETEKTKTSFMKSYVNESIPTVDNVDTPAGQVSLVYALAGVDGNFGVKKTATQLLPRLTH